MTPSLYDDLVRRNLLVSRLLLVGAFLVLSASAWAGSLLLRGVEMAAHPSVALLLFSLLAVMLPPLAARLIRFAVSRQRILPLPHE